MENTSNSPTKLSGIIDSSKLPVANPLSVTPVYSNHIGAGGTATDFTLFFMELAQLPGEQQVQKLKAAITLPRDLAGPLIQVLQQVIDQGTEAQRQLQAARAVRAVKVSAEQ